MNFRLFWETIKCHTDEKLDALRVLDICNVINYMYIYMIYMIEMALNHMLFHIAFSHKSYKTIRVWLTF